VLTVVEKFLVIRVCLGASPKAGVERSSHFVTRRWYGMLFGEWMQYNYLYSGASSLFEPCKIMDKSKQRSVCLPLLL